MNLRLKKASRFLFIAMFALSLGACTNRNRPAESPSGTESTESQSGSTSGGTQGPSDSMQAQPSPSPGGQ